MMSTRFSSFLLMFILLLRVGNSSAAIITRQAKEKPVFAKGSELAVDESMRSLEISDGVPAAIAEVSNTRLRGRKMMLMKRVLREKMKEEPLNKENSKISGKRTYASKKHHQSSQESLKDQNESRLLKAKSWSARSQQAPAKRPNQASYQYSKPVSTTTGSRLECSSRSTIPNPQEFDSSSQNLESQKLLDKAAMEIVNLMNKDYPGGGGPRHKPPINNDQPMSDQQHYPRP